MPSDFTVIQAVRQRFGDQQLDEYATETEAPFVGYAKVFPFSCPNVDSSQMAVLHLESLGLTADRYWQWSIGVNDDLKQRNKLMINDGDVPGGLTPAPWVETKASGILPFWKAHSLLVPAYWLKEENTLYIEAATMTGPAGQGPERDNFIIDNVVIFYKTLS